MFFSPTLFWTTYTVVNLLFLSTIWSSKHWPRLTRLFYLLLFSWAAWFNATTALEAPWVYQDYADTAIPVYKWFILGPFATIIKPMILVIAASQALIALTMTLKGDLFRLGCWDGLIFGLAIAPLGWYAAFPATVLMAIAFYRLQQFHDGTYLWETAKIRRSGKKRKPASPAPIES
ncbi:hypothetical protein [Larkinella rosea]|uniref:Uncharacterized protein n=1 Tax=Larkinella rosea TaxID=2025312 RepID=A0A3P1BFY9_9BACT|nr:hypothetical protein [Larkinella rosea]RRA99990.1 hypothetical protein EHT25_25540 [Larkinella rosea]